MEFVDLPDDVILYLIKFLELEDKSRLSNVNRRLYGLVELDIGWFQYCWEAISPFCQFKILPEITENQSFMNYFSKLYWVAMTNGRCYDGVNSYNDVKKVKVGDETWTKIDNFDFQKDVRKVERWIADDSIRGIDPAHYDNAYLNDVIRYKRSHVSEKVSYPNGYLSAAMRADLWKMLYIRGCVFYEDERHVMNLHVKSEFSDKESFRKIFYDVPLFLRRHMKPHKETMVILALIMFEYFEEPLKNLVIKKEIPFHKLNEILSELLECSVLKTFKDLNVFHNYDDYDEFSMHLDIVGHEADNTIKFKDLKELFSNMASSFPELIKKFNKNCTLPGFTKSSDDFLNEKMEDFRNETEDVKETTLRHFFNFYINDRYDLAAKKLLKPMEMVLFPETSGSSIESSSKSVKTKVYQHALNDSVTFARSKSTRLFMNDEYAVLIIECDYDIFSCATD